MELLPLQEGPRGFVELQKNHLINPMPKQFKTCKAKFCVQESPETNRTKKARTPHIDVRESPAYVPKCSDV
jgi:hypothetical protein